MNYENIIDNVQLKNIYLGMSENCNASCSFCYREFYTPKPKGFMSEGIFTSILRQIRESNTIESVSLTVGEPTLHPQFDAFSKELNRDKTYKTTVVTNMSMAHKHIDSLMGYDGIVMSIEGHDKESYENLRKGLKWERVRENVKMLDKYVKANSKTSPLRKINFIVDKASKVKEFVNVWSDYTDIIMIDPMLPHTFWKEGKNELKKTSENLFSFSKSNKIVCTEPFYRLGVLADGSVKPCGTRMYEQKDYGNYSNLQDVFNEQKNILWLRNYREKNKMLGCKNCRHSLEVDTNEWQNLVDEHKDLILNKNVVFAKGLMEVNGGTWEKQNNAV